MNFLMNRCRRRTHLTEELVEEVWQQNHRDVMFAFDVEDAISECLELGQLLHHAWDNALDHLYAEEIDDVDGLFAVMTATVARAIDTLKRMQELARLVVKNGYELGHSGELDACISELERLQHGIEERWPKADQQMIAESLAAYHRGEYQTAEELMSDSQNRGASPD